MKQPIRWKWFLLIALSIVITAIFFLFFLEVRNRDVHRKSVEASFRNISGAIQLRAKVFGKLPKPFLVDQRTPPIPIHSWRLAVGDYMEMYGYPPADLEEPWNNKYHSGLRSMSTDFAINSDRSSNFTNVFAVTGKNTAFGDGIDDPPKQLDRIPKDTIIAIEIRDSKTNWMCPGDFTVSTIESEICKENGKLKPGVLDDRIHVFFADGEVWAMSLDTPIKNLKCFMNIDEAKTCDRETELSQHCLKRLLPFE